MKKLVIHTDNWSSAWFEVPLASVADAIKPKKELNQKETEREHHQASFPFVRCAREVPRMTRMDERMLRASLA